MSEKSDKAIIDTNALEDIGDAIRFKNGETTEYHPSEMPSKIRSIDGSGGYYTGAYPINVDENGVISTNALLNIVGQEIIEYTQGKIINTSTNPITLSMTSQSGFCCALVPCSEGDSFKVTGRGGTIAHFAVFVDSDGNILLDYGVAGSWKENVVIIAPKNSAYLVLNNYNNYGTPSCFKGYPLTTKIELENSDFEVGGLNPLTGESATNTERLRTKTYINYDNLVSINATNLNKVALYKYDSSDNYVGLWNGSNFATSGNPYFFTDILFGQLPQDANAKYKLVIDSTSLENIEEVVIVGSLNDGWKETQKEIKELQEQINTEEKDTDYVSDNYYMSDDSVSVVSSSTALFALYDELVTLYPSYVTKNTLTSGDITTYEYVFKTPNYNDVAGQRSKDTVINKPVILLISGVHGDEKSSIMSTYAFCKAMCENQKTISTLLEKFIIRVIPCINAWGFDNNKRWNANGVNLNRNFDASWVYQDEPYTNGYSGPSPASEDETKIVQAWIDDYIDTAVCLIDFHNSAYTSEVSYVNAKDTLTNSIELKTGYLYKIDEVIGYWVAKREMTSSSLIFGYTGSGSTTGSCQEYGAINEKLSVLLETSWNQNSFGLHSNKTIGVGTEVLTSLLLGVVDRIIEVAN